jgi:hypothetical protein
MTDLQATAPRIVGRHKIEHKEQTGNESEPRGRWVNAEWQTFEIIGALGAIRTSLSEPNGTPLYAFQHSTQAHADLDRIARRPLPRRVTIDHAHP